jgi:hypothetical protein
MDSTDVEQQIMKAFPAYETYMMDFGFSPIHVAVLELYDSGDILRPSLQDLIDFVDDANNQPAVPRPIAILLPKPRKNIANDIVYIALDFFLTFYFLYNKLLII